MVIRLSNYKEFFNIAGIGAIGGVIAGQFSRHNCPITLLLKNEDQLIEYRNSGLTVISPEESFNYSPNAININDVKGKITFLMICVKAYDIINTLEKLKNNLDKNSVIVLIYNGMGTLDEIKQIYPDLRILSCVSYIGAYSDPQFTVKCYIGGKLYLGPSIGTFTHDEIQFIRKMFKSAKISFSWKKDMSFDIWKKFSVNCSINILAVLFNCKYGELLNHLDLLQKLTQEFSLVLKAYNVPISEKVLLKKVLKFLNLISESYSSTLQDVRRSKNTELPYFNGYLVKLAQEKNIPVDLNLKLLKILEERGIT